MAGDVYHEINLSLQIPDLWSVGLITGPSGSGKTTVARELFPKFTYHEKFKWESSCLLDDFSADIDCKQITKILSSVGFSSPPKWLLPYDYLSNGQKFRCDLARVLLSEDNFIYDEFTSFVDRQVAKITCAAVRKCIDKSHKRCARLVAVSCHNDIIEWLEPDWVLDLTDGSFKSGRLWRRPQIKIDVRKASSSEWRLFAQHHYLSRDIARSATCFVGEINSEPVAFCSYIHFPHPKSKNLKQEHRLVVLPDYQGVGIGNRLSECVGDIVRGAGFRFMSTTSAPSVIAHRKRSDKWRVTRSGRVSANSKTAIRGIVKSSNRLTVGFEYVG